MGATTFEGGQKSLLIMSSESEFSINGFGNMAEFVYFDFRCQFSVIYVQK